MRVVRSDESSSLTGEGPAHKVATRVGPRAVNATHVAALPRGNKTDRGSVVALSEQEKLVRFEEMILPHLDAAYNLARWLTRNDDDAQDMVQEAYLRAFRFFDAFHGTDGRAWLLTIVRNTCYTWLQQNRSHELASFDEEIHRGDDDTGNPASLVLKTADRKLVREAMEELPAEFREIVVLRDLEGFSYKQIAEIAKIPTGTVMSRLARARERLRLFLHKRSKKEADL